MNETEGRTTTPERGNCLGGYEMTEAELADFRRRLSADAQGAVEVDNPLRRELRPRRGTDETS